MNTSRKKGAGRPTRKIYVPSLIAYVEKRLGSKVEPTAIASLAGKLVCSPKVAAQVLDCGTTKLYELLNTNEIASYAEFREREAA